MTHSDAADPARRTRNRLAQDQARPKKMIRHWHFSRGILYNAERKKRVSARAAVGLGMTLAIILHRSKKVFASVNCPSLRTLLALLEQPFQFIFISSLRLMMIHIIDDAHLTHMYSRRSNRLG